MAGKIRLARRMEGISDSATLAISARAKQLRAQGIDVIDLGAGQPDIDVPRHIKEAAKHAIDQRGSGMYTPSDGTPELKQAIIEKLRKDNKIECNPGQILVSPGAKFSIYSLVQVLVDEGDEVVIPRPYWVSYPEMVRMAGGIPIFAETSQREGFRLRASAIQKVTNKDTRLIIINSPNNPTGAVYEKKDLEGIMKFALDRGIHVISDEVYEKIIYRGAWHVSPASLSPEFMDITFTVNGMSKSYGVPGWRLGYAAGPEQYIRAAAMLQSHSTSNPTSVVQMAFHNTLGVEAHMEPMLKEYQRRRDYITKALNELRMECTIPDGAFYVFPRLPKGWESSGQFCSQLLEKAHVASTPGSAFGAEGHVRFSYAAGMDRIMDAMKRLGDFLGK